MKEQRCVVATVGYAKLVLPLEHPLAGAFLNVLKEAIVLDEWSGNSKVTGKYEWNIFTRGEARIDIDDIKLYTKEELELHKNGSKMEEPVVPEEKPIEPSTIEPPAAVGHTGSGFDDDIPF